MPARRFPSQLAGQEPFLHVDYPKMPRRMIERIVGFFSEVADRLGSEAAVLLAWADPAGQMRVVVPEQVASVGRKWPGRTYPIDLKYETSAQPPDGWMIIGDAQSYVDYWPAPSYVDDQDETHRAGVHMIVGLEGVGGIVARYGAMFLALHVCPRRRVKEGWKRRVRNGSMAGTAVSLAQGLDMTTIDAVIEMTRRMPDNATVADIMAELCFRRKVDEGLRQLDAGEGIEHEQAKQRLARFTIAIAPSSPVRRRPPP